MVDQSQIDTSSTPPGQKEMVPAQRAKMSKSSALRREWRRFGRFVSRQMPTGLFGRSLIIIIAPMLILQAVVAYVFLERHWQSVTDKLSAAVVRDVAGLVDIIETYPQDADYETITRIAQERFELGIKILPPEDFPPPRPKPFFSILDTALNEELARKLDKPFWIDTVGNSKLLEIRIRLEEKVLRVFVRRNQAYASNTHIFLLWMVGAALVLITIAALFLRNQVRPIQRLAEAAEKFGKGQDIPEDFRPRGAMEVRRATLSFIEMRNRIERALDQRTAMLAGVSHDLRTVLTRFRLQLALVPLTKEVEALSGDVDDMQGMLQGYLDFARGDSGESAELVDLEMVLQRFEQQAAFEGTRLSIGIEGDPNVKVRPNAINRLMSNLILNAARHAETIEIRGYRAKKSLRLEIDDDGPGIPEDKFDEVFKPFVRLDEARNQDETGTGLGLAIAKDIVNTHGGKITLGKSGLGGLKVTVTLPV